MSVRLLRLCITVTVLLAGIAAAADDPPAVTTTAHTTVQLDARFETGAGELIFTVKRQKIRGYPGYRRWFLTGRDDDDPFSWHDVASGPFRRSDLVFRKDTGFTFASSGYALDCRTTSDTYDYAEATPSDRQAVRYFDASPPLFVVAKTDFREIRPLTCTLTTPTQDSFTSGSGSSYEYSSYLRTNVPPVIVYDMTKRSIGARDRAALTDRTSSSSVAAAFGGEEALAFFAIEERRRAQPTDRRWFLSNAFFGTDLVFYGFGAFDPGGLSVRRGAVSLVAEDHTMRCGTGPASALYTRSVSNDRKRLRRYDGSPTLFSSETWHLSQWSDLSCVLVTPSHGTLSTDYAEATRYRASRRANGYP